MNNSSPVLESLNAAYPPVYPFCARFIGWFMLWTCAEYWMHRLMHYAHPWNPLWHMHRLHHAIPIDTLTESLEYKGPKWYYFLWWFDNFHETAEIIIGETLPAILIYLLDPECGVPLLVFHYVYELVATDALLEHNAGIANSTVVSTFAVGQFHLEHHRNPRTNFGFTLACWDHLFGTFTLPAPKAAKQASSSSAECPASHTASMHPNRIKAE